MHDYQRRAVTACLAPAVILTVIFPASWVVAALLALATPIVPINMAVTGLGAEAVSRRQMHQVAQLSGQVLERLQAMSTLRALGAIGHQRRLVERAASELAHRTAAVLRIAFLASSALEWVSTFAIGLVAMYVGATLLGYVRVPLLPVHLGAQAGVFVLLLAPAYFAPLRRASPPPQPAPTLAARSGRARPRVIAAGAGVRVRPAARLSVAQAYLRYPGLLLLDEPTEGLDHRTARALLENLRAALPGTTIIAAIHDRTLDHRPVPADATVRLAAGRVLRLDVSRP